MLSSQVSSLFYPLHLYLSGQRGTLPTLKSRNYPLKPSKSLVSSMPDGPNHPETWVFHLAMAWLGNPDHSLSYKERLAMIKERAEELGEPARSAFTWIPPDTPVHKADISYWITQPWDNHGGRMTLVGDAAHPMPPCESDVFNHLAPFSIFSSEHNPEGNKPSPTLSTPIFPPFLQPLHPFLTSL